MAKKATTVGAATLVELRDLTGGIDLRRSPTLVPPTRAQTCRNFCLEEPGALKTVPGYASYGEAFGATVQGGARVYLDTATTTIVVAGGDVFQVDDDGDFSSPVTTGLHTTNQVAVVNDSDLVALFDASTTPKKSADGATWTAFGIAAPAAAPTAVTSSGGSLVSGNTYEFSYSGRDDGLVVESNESATVTAVPSTPNLTVVLTLPYHPDTQVDTLCVYARDVTAGESVRRRVGTVANPGSGTAAYTVTSNSWSAGIEAATDHDPPGALAFGTPWKNRWWARDAVVLNRIRFTQIFQPQSWPTLFYLDIPFTRGDAIRAMVPLGDTLVIFGDTGVFLAIGQTSLDFEIRMSPGALSGALGFRAVALLEQGIVHASSGGVYMFDGATDRLLSYDIDPGWQSMIDAASATDLAKIAMVYHEPRKEVRVAVPRIYPLSTTGEWVLDLNRTRVQESPAWYTTDRPVVGYLPWDGAEPDTGNRGRLFSWSGSQLSEQATGTTADGSDLVAVYEGPALATGLPYARFVDLYGEYGPATGTFGVSVTVDGAQVATETFTPGGGLATYGTGVYDTATYGAQSRLAWQTMLPLEAEGRTVTVTGQYTGAQAFRWYSYAVGVVPEAAPRGL